MKTKSIILLVLIASAMIQVFVYLFFVFVFVLILAMIQNQALVASKHYLVETESEKLADNAMDIGAKGGQTEYGGRLMDKDQRLFFSFQILYLTTVCVVFFRSPLSRKQRLHDSGRIQSQGMQRWLHLILKEKYFSIAWIFV